MEEIKALFFDIDGTIVEFQSNRIRKEVVQAISKAHENGYKVGIASSRPLTIINDIENIWEIPWDGIVAGSGTIVYDQNKEIYKNHSFSKKTLQKIFAIAQENDIAMYVCGEEAYFTNYMPALMKLVLSKRDFTTAIFFQNPLINAVASMN